MNLFNKKKSFFDKFVNNDEYEDEDFSYNENTKNKKDFRNLKNIKQQTNWKDSEEDEEVYEIEEKIADLSVDVYQTNNEIIVQTMVPGVRPEDLDISINRDSVTIKGKREELKTISEDNYFSRELYWGSFSRTISLPKEIDPEGAEAIERHGLLQIKLPKVDKDKKTSLKVKSL